MSYDITIYVWRDRYPDPVRLAEKWRRACRVFGFRSMSIFDRWRGVFPSRILGSRAAEAT